MPTEVDILLVPKISDSTQLVGKSLTISDDTDGTPYRFSGDTINNAIQEIDDKVDQVDGYQLIATADVNRLADTSGENTGDQQAADFDIKDLTDSTDLRGTWSGKQDALGFTPENVINKKQTVTNSETDYPSGKAVYDALALKENSLPATPDTPELKFLNGLRQWATIAIRHNQLSDPNSDENYQHVTKGAQTFEGEKTIVVPDPTNAKNPVNKQTLEANINLYNITLAIPLTAGQYYTSTTARVAVPSGVRKRGLELLYETASGVWYCERFIGASVTTWTTVTDWEVVPNKLIIENTEEVTAESLVQLKNRIDALQKIIQDMILGTVQIDTLSVVKTLNLFGSSNLILTGTAAPAVVPDFVGQFFIKTSATTACYQATGITAVGDWKQIG